MMRILTIVILGLAYSSLSAYQDTDSFIKELDTFLTSKQLTKIISVDKVNEIAHLAEEEDLELSDHYLVSDQLLRILKRNGIIDSEFGKIMEDFQAECDRLEKSEREIAIAKWKALWLDKASSHVRYVKSLKKLWTINFSNTIDHDSNVFQGDPSDPTTQTNSGKEDFGTIFRGGFTLRPLINSPKSYDWAWKINLNASTRLQAKEESLEYDTFGLRNTYSRTNISKNWKSLAFSQEYKFTGLETGADSGQFIFSLNSRFVPLSFEFLGFKNGINTANAQVRLKDEDASTAGASSEDVNTISLGYGQSFMRIAKNTAFQTLGWTIRYETQSVSPTSTRDNSSVTLGLNYSRAIPEFLPQYNLNLRNALSYRIKDWDTQSSIGEKDQNQISLSASLNATWNPNFSSSLSLSYLNKKTDYSTTATVASHSGSADQWRIALTNTLFTF